jgi:hypothetical protein
MKSPALKPRSRGGASLWRTLQALLVPALLVVLFVGVGVMHVTSRALVVNAGYALSRLGRSSGRWPSRTTVSSSSGRP